MRYEKDRVMARACLSHQSLQMSRTLVMAIVLILCDGATWGATLTWTANSEPDLAGYRLYQCSQQPCGRAFGSATPLATLGTGTSFDIGTPAVVQYYVITAYDFANNESSESNVATYTPIAPPPSTTPPPSTAPPPLTAPLPATVTLYVLGSPNLGEPWTVQATTNASGRVSMQVWINGILDHTERRSPYCAFGERNGPCIKRQKPIGTYNVEFRVLNGGTEFARKSIVVTVDAAQSPSPLTPPPASGNLTKRRFGFAR
jgi:hypothetical protein